MRAVANLVIDLRDREAMGPEVIDPRALLCLRSSPASTGVAACGFARCSRYQAVADRTSMRASG
jgi:hypothetical protein